MSLKPQRLHLSPGSHRYPAVDLRATAARPGYDATSVLSLFFAILVFIPSQFSVAAIGGIATPAQLVAMVCLVWWCAERVRQPPEFLPSTSPTTKFLLLFVAAILVSFVVAATRPISDDEFRSSQQALLAVAGWLGVYLIAADGIRSRGRLEVLLRRFSWIAGLVAVLAIAQFVTRQPLIDKITIPGLTARSQIGIVAQRGGLLRPAGTAIHPIEFGMLITMCLPFALHFALYGKGRRFLIRAFPALAISAVVAISNSRSTFICGVLVGLILLPTWPRVWRRIAYALLVSGTLVLYLISPGVVASLLGLFTGISDDSSALSRTDSYDLALQFVSVWPVFGRGFLTFLPDYRILDNQFLGLLIDTGYVGLTTFLATIVSAILLCVIARRRLTDTADRHLAQACLASVAAGALGFAFFDAMSFPQAAVCFFLVLGCAAALHRLTPQVAIGAMTDQPAPSVLRD